MFLDCPEDQSESEAISEQSNANYCVRNSFCFPNKSSFFFEQIFKPICFKNQLQVQFYPIVKKDATKHRFLSKTYIHTAIFITFIHKQNTAQ